MSRQSNQPPSSKLSKASDEGTVSRQVEFEHALKVATSTPEGEAPAEYTSKQIVELFRKVDASDPSSADVLAFRQVLQKYPELWQVAGDLSAIAVRNALTMIQSERSMKESIEVGLEQMRAELGYEHSSRLEQLLIQHIAVCWLRMNMAELDYTRTMKGSVSLACGSYMERKLNMHQERYLKALESLARVRRMLKVAPVQVNIGGQQINMVKP